MAFAASVVSRVRASAVQSRHLHVFRRGLRQELTQTALAVFVALLAILMTVVLVRLLGQAAGGRMPPKAVFSLLGYGALAQVPVVVTLAVFLSVLMALSRAYRDSEMVVWASAGVPLSAFVWPLLRFALPFVVVCAVAALWLSPWANYRSALKLAALQAQEDATQLAPGVFRESRSAQQVFFVEQGAVESGQLGRVFLASTKEGETDIVVAESGRAWRDENGNRHAELERGRRYEGKPGSAQLRVTEFDRFTVWLARARPVKASSKLKTIPTAQLLAKPDSWNLGELASRIGAPLSCLLLALLAIPLAWVNPRSGRGSNFVLAILVYLVYSNMMGIMQDWVGRDKISFWLAVTLPHAVAFAAAALLLYRRQVLTPFWVRMRTARGAR